MDFLERGGDGSGGDGRRWKKMGEDEHLRVSDGVWAAWRGTCFQEYGTAVHLVGKQKECTSERAVTPSKVVYVCVVSYSFIQQTRYFPGVS